MGVKLHPKIPGLDSLNFNNGDFSSLQREVKELNKSGGVKEFSALGHRWMSNTNTKHRVANNQTNTINISLISLGVIASIKLPYYEF